MSNEQFVVNGRIADSLNVPLKGIRVVSFNKDLRREEQLGDQVTDNNGYYEIRYLSQQFSHAEKESPDLFFKLFASTGEELTNFTATVK
jgi:hypothetical protein